MKYPIRKYQIKLIHTLVAKTGMNDSDYRALLGSRFNAKSCKDLTEAQASVLIEILREREYKEKATKKQRARFNYLYDEVYGSDKIKKDFIKEQLGYTKGFFYLTGQELSKLIYILEKIKRWKNEHRKMYGSGDNDNTDKQTISNRHDN